MIIDRRTLLKAATALSFSAGLPRMALAEGFDPQPGAWRTYEVTTRVAIAGGAGRAQAWVPVPSFSEATWFKSLGSTWTSNGDARLAQDPVSGAGFVHVRWADGERAPTVAVVSRITTRDRAVDLAAGGKGHDLWTADQRRYTAGSALIPVDGIVKETADKITAGIGSDEGKAHAIYEWIVENTSRNPNTRGCGIGDIVAMLKSGNLSGKCADLNALYVGLARASGLPARDVYGIRVAPSRFGYKSLGAGSPVITKAQHCRAETFIAGHGWVPTDPADVRKVMLEEPPGHLPLDNRKVAAARKTLFGAWEGNFLVYNVGHDVALPGAAGPKLAFLMYPQAECGGNRLDCLDPETFRYTITAKDVTAT